MIEDTIGNILDKTTEKYPDNDALVYVDRNLRYSYSEFRDRCNDVAKGLMALGIKKGDRVAVWAYNIPEWALLQFATAKIGAVLVTVNTYYKSHELEYLLKQSDATTIFLTEKFKSADYVETLYKVVPKLKESKPGKFESEKIPFLKNAVFIGESKYPGMFNFEDIIEMGKGVTDEDLKKAQNALDPHDVINMQYTSGTTGFPKGVMLTHHGILNNAAIIGRYLRFTDKDRLCIPVPFFHCFGCVLGTLLSVVYGSAMIPIETFDAGKVLEAVAKEKCTALYGVPTMFIAELNHKDFDKHDYSSLRTGIMAGAPCPVEVMKKVNDKMNMSEVTICYGLTESSPVITQTAHDDPLDKRVETVGKPHPENEVKIVDPDTMKELPRGTPGELIVKGYNIMKGYYKNEEATSKAIVDGWLRTKDLSTMDEEGYIRIMGRIDDMIIRGGENVYPREIEEYLYTNPKIETVAVIGIPSKHYGEEVLSCIKLKEGQSATEDEIKAFCKEGISRFKVPKFVRFVESYPMTASGKIQKFKLRDTMTEKLKEEGMLE